MPSVSTSRSWIQSQAMSLTKVFDKSNPQAPILYTEWLNVLEGDAERSFFQVLPFYGFGMLQQMPEGGSPALDQGGEGVPSFFPYVNYGLKYAITKPGRREDPYKINAKLPRFLRWSSDQTWENLFWNILTQAFNAQVTIFDGQPLCSQNHTLAGTPGVTYSNSLGNVALTPESLQQAFTLMATLPDDKNLASFRTPKKLISVPGYHRVIEEVTGSAYYPWSNENRPNVVYGKVEPLEVRYIPAAATGPFPWFVSSGKGDLGEDAHASFASFKWKNEQKVWYDDDTDVMYHKTDSRLTWGSVDGRGLVGSAGA